MEYFRHLLVLVSSNQGQKCRSFSGWYHEISLNNFWISLCYDLYVRNFLNWNQLGKWILNLYVRKDGLTAFGILLTFVKYMYFILGCAVPFLTETDENMNDSFVVVGLGGWKMK